MNKIKSIGLSLVVISALSLALSGCSDNDNSASNPAPTPTPTPPVVPVTDDINASFSSIIKQTGQTTSFSANDDGDLQKGLAPNYTRASDTVTDDVTKLMWQDDAAAKSTVKSYEDAYTYCSELSLSGYTDWRLPAVNALESILNYGRFNPSINTTFTNSASERYWSSSAYEGFGSDVWTVDFKNGYVQNASFTDTYYVRCVREVN